MLCVQGEEAEQGGGLRVVRAGRALVLTTFPVAVAAVGAPRTGPSGQGPVVAELAVVAVLAHVSEEVAAHDGLRVLAREVPRHLPLRRLLEADARLGEVPLVFLVLLARLRPDRKQLLLARLFWRVFFAPIRVLVEAPTSASASPAALASLIPALVERVLVRRWGKRRRYEQLRNELAVLDRELRRRRAVIDS